MTRTAKTFQTVVCLALAVQLAGCGTLMYPERRGQRGGRIDVGVAVLDGLGLLFFVIPGIIAFAVDFSEGTIYLPGTALSALDAQKLSVARFDPKRADAAAIEEIVWQRTGHRVRLNQDTMQVARLESREEMRKRFAAVLHRDIRVALLKTQ